MCQICGGTQTAEGFYREVDERLELGRWHVMGVEGDPEVLGRLVAVLAPVDPDLEIVVP